MLMIVTMKYCDFVGCIDLTSYVLISGQIVICNLSKLKCNKLY